MNIEISSGSNDAIKFITSEHFKLHYSIMTKPVPPQNHDTFHRARSRLIDSFARLEVSFAKALQRAGRPVKGDTLATKLRTLRDATPTRKLEQIGSTFDRIGELIVIRADLVHAPMELIDLDGERFAYFRNARESINAAQKGTQINYKNLKSFSEELDLLAKQVDAISFNPPSSPPPPSQDAAVDP